MKSNKQIKEKLDASLKLLDQDTTTFEKFESIRKLIEGLNPRIDRHLKTVSKAFSAYKKIESGDLVELGIEHLPAKTEKDKKRKKALLLLIQSWTQLKNEVERVRSELKDSNTQSSGEKLVHTGKIIKFAKGPFGIITLAAIAIVIFSLSNPFTPRSSSEVGPTSLTTPTSPIVSGPRQQFILFKNKKIPVTELAIRDGPDCGGGGVPHYHAVNGSFVTALDQTQIPDPGACAYGKVSEVKVQSE